jgi:hypothetical protein
VKRRSLILGAALAGAIALTAWTLTRDDDAALVQPVVQPVVRAPATAAGAPARAAVAASPDAGALALGPTQRPTAPQKVHNVFGAYNYQPAPRAQAVVVAEVPHAPPLPFIFSGRLIIPGRPTTYLLTQGETPIEVRLGSDVGGFKLVDESPAQLVFLHAATGDRVAMSIASAAIN